MDIKFYRIFNGLARIVEDVGLTVTAIWCLIFHFVNDGGKWLICDIIVIPVTVFSVGWVCDVFSIFMIDRLKSKKNRES